MNLLFICSKNKWRSPTAEAVWKNKSGYSVRSAGTASGARRKVSKKDISWADVIFVMEQHHKKRLLSEFPKVTTHKKIHVLEIQDEYQYMDPELIEMLDISVSNILKSLE